jgi:hypothetical protein
MIESAVREGRPECGPAAEFYTWEIPGKPVAVAIPLALIDQMEREAVENFRSLSSRGSEIGGLLLGTVAPGNPALVTVTSCIQVACDYALGPLYRLSETDLHRLDDAIAQAAASAAAPLGFFRSHTRKGLPLDPADRKLLSLRFAHPHCVALLIRPSATKASTAGIFIWENGEIQGEASYLEFPFRASELTPSIRSINTRMPRARVVPIASRLDPVSPSPEASAPSVLPYRAVGEISSPRENERELVAVQAATASSVQAAAKGSGRMYLFLSAIVVIGIALLFLVNSGMLRPGVPIAPPPPASLSLRVERRPGDMLLSWDLHSPAIQNASGARVEISDGPRHQSIDLDRIQLQNGSIAYSPATGDVIFKMDVSAGDHSNVSESLQVFSTPAPALPPNIQRAAAPRKPENPPIDPPASSHEHDPKPPAASPSASDPETEVPQLISRTEPEYTDAAREAGVKGPVNVIATVGEDGKVKSVKPVSGSPLLIGPATEAIMHWRYEPAHRNGVPVESETDIVLSFTAER